MGVTDDDILDRQVLAIERMQVPARRVLKGAVLDEDPLALPEGNHHGTEERLDLLLVQGRVGIVEGAGGGACLRIAFVRIPDGSVLGDITAPLQDGLPLVLRDLPVLDLPPVFAAAVDDTAAGDGNVMRAGGVQRGQAAPHVQAFEIRVDDGVQVLVGVEDHDGILLHAQFDMALELDGTGAPDTGRDDELAAALLFQGGDGIGKGGRVQDDAVPHAPEIGQGDRTGGDGRKLHPGHVEGKSLVKGIEFGTVFARTGGCKGDSSEDGGKFVHRDRSIVVSVSSQR